jgi:death-on-curing protein
MDYLTPEQVLFIHARLIAESGGTHGIRDLGLFISAVKRPKATFDRQDLYPDVFSKAVALFDSLIRNHPFLDGNKRTAITAASLFLLRNGYQITASNEALTMFTMVGAKAELSIEAITRWFKANTHQVFNN